MNTVLVNIFGGPGTGKSISMAHIFALLKWKGYEVEMAPEYAKDKVWEGSLGVLDNQLYIFAKQLQRSWRVHDKVDVIVTDAPLLNSILYDEENDADFRRLILKKHDQYKSYNIFLERNDEKYVQNGRLQDLEAAKNLDKKLLNIFEEYRIPYYTYKSGPDNIELIVNDIIRRELIDNL